MVVEYEDVDEDGMEEKKKKKREGEQKFERNN